MIKNKINILHISDLHIQNISNSSIRDYNKNWYEFLLQDIEEVVERNNLKENLFITITGDITYSGNSNEFRFASKIINNLTSRLDLPENNVLIVPGNHDIDWSSSKLKRTSKLNNFLEFSSFLTDEKIESFPCVKEYRSIDTIFILLDTSRERETGGVIGKSEIKGLNSKLERLDLNNKFLVMLMHHGIDKGIVSNHLVKNTEHINNFINRWSIDLIITSGQHNPNENWSIYKTNRGSRLTVSAGVASPESWRNHRYETSYQILSIDSFKSLTINQRIYNRLTNNWERFSRDKIKLDYPKNRPYEEIISNVDYRRRDNRLKNIIFEQLSNLSNSEISDLYYQNLPSINPFDPFTESKLSFIDRLIDYFDNENSLKTLENLIESYSFRSRLPESKLFISHNFKDHDYAYSLASELENKGFKITLFEDSAVESLRINELILSEIEKSAYYLILLSPDSLASNLFLNQIEQILYEARTNFKKIFIVVRGNARTPIALKNYPKIMLKQNFEIQDVKKISEKIANYENH